MIFTVYSFMAYGATLTLSGAMENLDYVADYADQKDDNKSNELEIATYDMIS